MMTREHHGNHRRRSPESERRRRKDRRNSREQVLNQLQHIPEADQYQIAVRQQPSHNDSYETQLYTRPSSSYAQPHPPPQSQSQYSRSRALSSSGESSSSSTSSSLVNISRHGRGFGFKSFFTAAAEKHKRRVRKQRSRRMFRFGNGSSSSDLSDLAYGKGYIDRRRSRDFTPPGSQKRRDSGERPGPPKRAQTDEEIIELGRKFAEIARQQNKEDLRRAGRHKPSALLGAATALSAYNKTSSGGPADRGIGSSKHSRRHSSDDSEWESASEDESSSEDDGLMYGSATHLPSDGQHPIHISSPPPVHGQGEYERMLQHKPSIVDPNLFGPVNSLRGHVNTPCGFDKLDRGTVINGYQVTEAARPSASIPQNETVSYEDRPLQHVYPIPTSDPNVYKTGRGSMVSIEQDSPRGRPAPVPIQQPKPIAPVSSKVFEATDADARYSRRSSSSGTALAGAAAVGLAGAAIANVVANHKDKDDRREGLDKYHQERRERDIEKGRERERDEKRRSKRSDDKYAESSYTESRHGDERDEKRKSRRSGDKHTDSRYAESQIGDDRDQKRRSRHSDDKHDEREEKRKSRDGDRDYEREEKRREKEKLKELEASGSKRAEDADRENVRDKPVRKDRDDDHDYSREYRGHERREDRKKDKERRKEERRQEKSLAGRSSDIDVYRRLEDPEDPLYEGPIDPFQFQVPNDAFATPQRPLTPNVFTVDREPDFSKFDDDFKPPERMSRRDSYERELMDTEAIYDSTRNATVPIAAGAIAAATAAIGMEERRGRSRSRGGDETSRVRQDNHDVVQDVANILYRRDLLARQAAEERSRSTSPDHSVLDKWKEDPETTAPEIITPPAKDAPKPKSPYDGPDADVRIDNILTPRDLPLRANGRSFISRDPSAERDRPVLNLVRPTPAPTPQPEKQKAREDTREEIPREKESKREFKKKKRNPPLIEHIKSVDDVVISPRGEVVSTPSTPTSKGVTWGMNETRRYVVESPERGHDEHSGSRVVTPAETPKSKSGKKSGWGILASAIAGTGAAAAASVISDSGKDKDKDETSSNVSSTSRRSRDRDSPREKGLERDEVGSNVSSNSRKSKDRDFPKDRDREEISSNVSSSSKKSRDRDSPEFKDMDRDDIFSNISSSSKRSRDRDLPKDRDEIASNVSSSSRKSRDRDTPRDRDEVSSNISSSSRKSRDSPKGKRQSSVPWDEIEEPPIPGPKPSSPRGAPMPGTFAEDMAFTATIAAGLQDSGFDPNIVIDDAKYHRRDSPPNTNGKPNLYSAPFAETVTDLGIYPAEATGSKSGSDHGFVIGEIPETPQDQRDIPSDMVDLSKLSKKERKKLERENSAKRDNLENLDDLRSQIVVEEEPAAPQSVPERLVEDDDWTSTATLSKKERKKRDKAARAKALQEEESAVSTPRDSEPETPQPTMEEDVWGSSSKLSKKEKKKLEKAGKNKALEEEEIVEIPTPQEPEHHPIGAKIVDEWEDSSSKKKSKKDKKKEKAVIVQDDAKDLGDMESSKISVPVDTFRDIQEEKRFAQPEDDWSGPSKKSKKKGKRDSASYDFTSEPATPVGGEDVGYIQEEAQIAQPDDDWALPGSSKKSKKKSKQDSEHYDSSSQSFTPHETDTPSGLVQEEAPFPQPEDDWTSSTTKKSKKKSKRDSEIYDSPSQSVLPSESESPRDLQEETTIARPEDDWAAPATKKSKKKSKRNSEILDSPSQTATPTEIDVPRDIQESSFVQPEDDWSAPSKKSKKKSKRDSEVYDSPSQSTAQFEKGESPKNDGEDEITVVPDDEWDVSKKSTKRHSKQDSFATDTTDWTNVPSVASESMIKSQSTDYFSTAEPASVDDWELPSKKSKKKSKRESTSYDSPSQTPTGRDDIVESPKAMTESFSDLRSEKSGAQNDEWDEPKKSKKKSKRDSHIHDSPSGSRSASLSRTQSEISTSDKKKSKRNSYHESLPGSEIGSESSERKSKKEKRRSLPGGFPDDFDDRDPPDRGRKDFPFLDNDVSSVVSAPLRDRSEKRSRSRFDDLDDDAKSIASAPGGSRKKDSKSEKDKEKRSSAGPGLFDRFKSSIGIVDASDKSSRKEEDKKALKDNAGTLGASVGLLGAAAALITSQMSPSNATDVPSEGKEAHSIPTTPSRRLSPSPPPRRSSDSIDPEIVQREIRPAIDPQYGDLLPLPPSPPPGLPTTHETDDLPALPDSRPETPETERQLLRELHNKPSHIRRKSANETPTRLKSPSQSAIPLRFGVGKVKRPSEPPSLPGFHRSSPISSPIAAPTDTLSATKPRPARPTSWDSTREFKPLYLVEKTSRESVTAPPEIEGDLPQLPESGPPSRESPGPEFGRREHDVQYEHAQSLSNDLALKLDIPAALAVSDDTHLGSQDTTPKAQTSGLSDAFGTPRQTEEKSDSSNLPSLPGTETHSTPKPEPVESMSKDRSSYLLHSSPPSAVKNFQSDDIAQDSPTRSLSRSGVLSDISEGGDEAASKKPVDLGLVTGIAAGAAAAITLLDEDRSIPAKDIQNDEEPSEFAYTPSKKSKKSKKAKKSTAAEVEESPISAPPIPTSQIIEESSTSKDITEDDSAFIPTSKKGKKSKKNKKALDWEPEREPEVQDTTILANDQLSTSDNQVLPPPDEIPGAIQEIEQQQPKSDTEAPLLQRSTSSSKKDKKKKGKSLAWDPEPEPESVYATPMEPVLGKSTDFVFPQSTLKELDTAQEVVQRNLSEPTQQSRIEESQPTVAEEPVSTTKNSKKKGKASQLQSQSWEPEPDSGFIQDVEIANSVNTSSEATQIAPAMEIETVLPFEEQFSTPTEELQHTPMVDLPLRADLSPALETRQPDALQSTSAGDQLTTNTSGLESASVEMPSLGRTSPAPEPDLPAPIPADLQAENHTDTMDFSDARVVESPLPGNVAEAPLQPNPGSGESQWHLEPGLNRPAQPPASLGENIDSNAISVGSNLSSGQGFSEPFGSWQEDSSSKKKKSKKDKKQQSISRELEPGTPSDASEIISDPLSRSVDLSEQPVEASPLSNELPSSSQPEMEATADDIWSTSAKSGKKGKKGKKNRQSSGPNDLGETAQQPAGEIPFVSHEGRDTQLEPGGGSQLPASTSWAGEVEGSDPVISEPQPEPEATISKKKSKKDKKKNRASSQFDDDLGEVPPQKLQEPTLSQEMPIDAATIAEPAPILSEDRAFEQPELKNGLVDELSPAASQKSEQKKKDQSIQWEDPPFASDAPQESHDVSPSGGETPQAEDNWDSGFTSSKKSKKDKKKRKVIFAGTSDEQLRDNALTEESAQTSGGIQPQPGPALESGSDVPGEDLPTAETTQLGIVPDALSGDTVHHQSEAAPGNSGGDLNVIHSSSETRDLPESDVPQQSGHVQELSSEPASEQLLEGTSSLTTEDPGTQLASQELPAASAEEEFPIMTTKKSKKDKKKRKGKTDDLLESTSGTSTPQDEIALGTSTPEPVISATIQDQAPLEQAISASQIVEEPQEVKLEDQTMDDEWGSLPAKKSKKDKKKNKKGSQIQELEPEKLPMEESQIERRPSSSPTTTLPDPVLDPLEKSMLAPLGHSQLSRPQSPILPQDSSEPIVSGQQDLSEEPIQSPAADPVANLLPQFSELETGLLPSSSQGADEIVSESQKPHSDEPTLERPQLLAHTTDYFDSVASQVVSEGASTPAEQSLEAGEDEFAPTTSKKDKKKKKRRSLAQEPELARKSSFEEMMGDWQADEPLPTPGQDFYTPLEQPTETQQDQPAENSTKTSKKDRKKKRASRIPSDDCSTPPSDQALAERPASPSQVLNSDSNPTESQTLALVDEPAPIQEQDEALPTILEQSIELPQPSQVPDEQLVSNPELMADIQNITGEPLSRTEMPAAIQVDETPAMDSLPTPLGHDGNDEVRQKDSIAIAHEQQQSPLPDVQPAEVESTQSFTTPKSKKDKKKKKRGSQILADEAVVAPEDDLPASIPVSQDQDLGVQSQMPEASSQPIESQPVEFQHEEIPISTPLVEESSQFSAEPGIPTTKKSKKDKKKKKQTTSWEDDLPRDQIETPVDQIGTPVDQIGASVGQIETPVDQIGTTTDQIETPLDQIETPIDQIETPIDQIETPVDQIGTAIKQIETPVDQIETTVKQSEISGESVPTEQLQTDSPIHLGQSEPEVSVPAGSSKDDDFGGFTSSKKSKKDKKKKKQASSWENDLPVDQIETPIESVSAEQAQPDLPVTMGQIEMPIEAVPAEQLHTDLPTTLGQAEAETPVPAQSSKDDEFAEFTSSKKSKDKKKKKGVSSSEFDGQQQQETPSDGSRDLGSLDVESSQIPADVQLPVSQDDEFPSFTSSKKSKKDKKKKLASTWEPEAGSEAEIVTPTEEVREPPNEPSLPTGQDLAIQNEPSMSEDLSQPSQQASDEQRLDHLPTQLDTIPSTQSKFEGSFPTDIANEPKQDQIDIQEPTTSTSAEISQELEQNQPSKQQDTELGTGEPALSEEQQPLGQSSPIIPPATEVPVLEPDIDLPQSTEQSPQEEEPGSGSFVTKKSKKDKKKKRASQIQDLEPELSSTPVVERSPVLETPVVVETPIIAAPLPDAEVSVESELPGDSGLSTSQTAQSEDVFPELVTGKKSKKDKKKKKKGRQAQDWEPEVEPAFATPLEEPARQLEEQLPPPTTADLSLPIEQLEIENVQLPLEQTSTPSEVPRENDAPALEETQPEDVLPQVVSGKKSKKDKKKKRASQLQDWEPESSLSSPIQDQPVSLPTELDTGSGEPAPQEGVSDFKELEASQDTNSGSLHDVGSGQDQKEEKDQDTLSLETPGIDSFYTPFEETHGSLTTFNDASLPKQHVEMSGNSNDDLTISKDLELDDDFTAPTPSKQTKKDKKKKKGQQSQFDREDPDISIMPVETQPVQELPSETPLVEEFLGGGDEVILDDSALPRDLQPEDDVPEFVSTKKSKKDKKKGKKAAALQTEPELDSSSRDLPGESSLPHTESPSDQIPSAVNENLDVATEHENLRSDPLENLEVSSHQPSSQLESLTQPEDSTTPVAKDVDEVPDGGHGSLAPTDNYDRSQDPAIVHAEDLSKDSTFGTVPDATTIVSQDDSTEFPDFAVKKSKKDKKKGKKSKASESLPWQDNMETSGRPTPIEEPVLSQEVQQDVLTGSTPTTQLGALDEAIPQDIPLEQPSTLPIHADDTPIGNVGTPQSQLLADDPVVQPTEPMISTPDVVEEDLFPIGRKKSKKDKKKQKALALVDSEPTSGTQTPPTQDEQTPGLPLPEALPLESQGSTSTREVVEEVPSQDPMELDIGGKTVTEQPDPSQVVIEDWPDFSAKKSKKDKKKRKSTAQSLDFETPSGVQTPSIEDAPLDREIGGDIATVEESKPLFTEQPISGEPLQATPAEPVEQVEWPQNTSNKSKKDKKKRKSSGLLESEPTSGTQTPLATDVALGEDLSRNIPALEQPASEVMELPPVEEVPESSAAPVGDDEWANFTSSKKSKKDKKGKKKGKSSGTATPLETTQPVIIPTQDDRQESVAENPEPSAVKDVWADDAFFKPQETTPGMSPKLESSQAENIPLDRPGTPPGLSTSTIPPAVDVDLSPAQLTSHVDHDKPFDQTTQRGKKVRMNTFLGDTEIPESISATEPISADRDLAASYLEDSSQTPNEPTVPEVVMEDSSAHLPERTLSPPTARDIAVDYLNPQHDQGGASGSADTTNLNKDLDASLPNVNADREFAVSYLESQTKNMEDIISQTEHEQLLRVGKSGPPAITPRREIAASYFDPEPGVLEGKRKGVIAAEYPPKLDEPSLNIKDGGQTQQDATHDLAADLMEPPPSTSKKSSKSTTSKEESEKDDKSKDAEAIAAAAALTGGVAMLADKFGGSKKGKGKKGKKSKYVDKRQPKEDDLFDDPSLWESSDRKIVTENDGGRLNRDVGDFWGVPADAEEDQSGPSFSQEIREKDSEGQARGAVHEIIAGSSASPESPVVGRVEMKSSATKSESLSKDRLEQLESRAQEEASNSRLMRDIDELDTSESVPERGFEETPGLDVRQQIPSPSRDMADWGRSSIMSARSLPPVEEEPNEDLEEELHRSRSRSRSRHVAHDPEVNRDSGFITDSPRPTRRSLFEDSRQRDSGVHMKDWPESTGKKREGLSLFDETGARLSWESTDSKTGIPREVHTPKAEEKKLRKSTLGDETPRLDTPSRTHRETSPDPEKKGKSHAVETKTPRPAKYQNLGAGASPALTPHAFGQRSASDNMSRDGTPRGEHSARRSASNTSISRLRTPEPLNLRPGSPGSIRSSGTNTPPLRRVDKRMSGDLRSLSQHNASVSSLHSSLSAKPSDKDAAAALQREKDQAERRASQTFSTPVANEGRVRQRDMTDVYVSDSLKIPHWVRPRCRHPPLPCTDLSSPQDGVGEGRIGSPRSPTRPHSMRRRQSMQVLELESRVEQLVAENRMLADARLQADANGNQRAAITINERDALIEQLRSSLEEYKREVERLKEVNEGLHSANAQLATQQNERYSHLQLQHASASSELEGMRSSLDKSLQDKDAEIEQLRNELEATRQQVRAMQQQILASKPADADFLRLKDEDHFDHRCQQLCAHVQQWVLRFSKFSDMRASRLTSEINDVKIVDKLDNTVLDGSDVDDYLSDRVKRRDIFMSMTMHMIWEYVFTRYLFGMDREQRQKLKTLEKLLSDVGPPHAVRQWRAVTLTLLSRRPVFGDQRNDDTEAVVQAILETLSKILPPPSNMENQIQSQLRRVLREAVDLSIEMRTQRAEYMMLPPLQPEYDANGDLAETVAFNAALMNERSGGSTSNEELEAQGAVVRMVLFPLVIKKGDDNGVGDDEIVVCPAQVLVAKQSHHSMRMVTPSSEFGGAPLSRGATPSVGMKSAISLPMSPGSQAGDYNMEGAI
ncbi:hypothetical protein SCUP234_11256 [Seiridium cupressi]